MRQKPIKVAFIGNGAVGKTSIITRYLNGIFNSVHMPSIGSDFESKRIVIDSIAYDVHIWDTAGQEVYHSVTPVYVQNSQIVMLCFDPSNIMVSWEDQVKPWLDILSKRKQTWILFLVATKRDMYEDQPLDADLLAALQKKANARDIYITSARTGAGINELFEGTLRSYLKAPITPELEKGLDLDNTTKGQKACC